MIERKFVAAATIVSLYFLYSLLASSSAHADQMAEVLWAESNIEMLAPAADFSASDSMITHQRGAAYPNVRVNDSTGFKVAALRPMAVFLLLVATVLAVFNARRGRKTSDAAR